jgi:hypothetical protein
VGRSNGQWLKGRLTTNGEKMASAYVQCTRLINKREGLEEEEDKVFERGDDGEWYEEIADGAVVKARSPTEGMEADAEAI